MRGGCLVQLARTQEKEGKYVDAEANARRAVAIFERFPLSGNFGLSTALIVLGDTLEDLAANLRSAWYIGTAFLLFVSWEQPEEH